MKWKPTFPHFVVTIPDLIPHIHQVSVPIRHGSVPFIGAWPDTRPADATDPIAITAEVGCNWDGFYLGYELTATVPSSAYGLNRFAERDLRDLRVRYTDDRLEAEARRATPVEVMLEELRRPENRISADYMIVIPGGECLLFSKPLRALMFRGAEARAALLDHIDDPEIRNEVILLLGAVGNEETIPHLIARYPRGPYDPQDPAATLSRVCFSYALCWLTSEPIDRSRSGTNCLPGDAERWEVWWAEHRETFRVSPVKPYATWVPSYPLLADDHVERIRSYFAAKGFEGYGSD